MSKLTDLLARNQDKMREDAGERPAGHAAPTASKLDGRTRMANAAAIALDRIAADPQTREVFDEDELRRLAESLKTHGQIQPILVRYDEQRQVYVVVAGERRLRAARLAGLPTINCVVVEKELTEAERLNLQILENAARVDLRPVEQAKAFDKAMRMNGWDGKTLAEQLNLNPSTVSRSLALLKLPDEVQRKVDAGDLPPRVAIQQTPTVVAAKGRGKPGRASSRSSREHTLRVSGGVAVVVKGRRNLTNDEVAAALREALGTLGGEAARAA